MKRILLLYIIFLSVLCSFANSIGKWTLYPAYRNISYVAPAGKDIFVISSGSLFSYNIDDNSLQTYTKNDVLTDVGIKNIAWVKSAGKLAIIYDSGIIDFLSLNGNVTTLSDIADKNMTDDKTINDIFVSGQYAYLATGFGVIKINVKEEYVVDTYRLGVNITAVALKDSYVYARTDSGVLKCKTTDNILNKSSWVNTSEDWQSICPNNNLSNEYGTLFFDQTNKCYWGNNNDGKLTRYEKTDAGIEAKTTGVAPDGPFSNNFWRIYIHDGKVFCAAGNLSCDLYLHLPGLVQYMDENKEWKKIEDPGSEILGYNYVDANCIAFDPKDKNHFFVGAASGIYEYRDYKIVNAFNSQNSELTGMYNSELARSLVTSMTFDNEGNLWIMNGWCDNIVVCYTKDGEWKKYPQSEATLTNFYGVDLQGCFISPSNNRMWWSNVHWGHSALYSYDYKKNEMKSYKNFFNQDNQSLTLHYSYNICEDKKGNIWLATSTGPTYLSKEDILEGNEIFTQHKVPRNDGTNYADYLMNNIPVRIIAVDAENRKWMGTTDLGIYVISDDCNEEVYHFTNENSPLISNFIYDITIDDKTGEVYIATDKGLCSFTTAVKESNTDMTDDSIYSYPNPVTPEYSGDVSIIGLAPGAQVMILTTSGQLINKGTASGGVYNWNCKDKSGNRVASGVYMVAVTDNNGDKGVVTKIAVVK